MSDSEVIENCDEDEQNDPQNSEHSKSSANNISVENQDFESLSLKELKEKLKNLGLKTIGNKPELIDRCREFQRKVIRVKARQNRNKENNTSSNSSEAEGAVGEQVQYSEREPSQSSNAQHQREIELLKRERDILAREKEYLLKELELEKKLKAVGKSQPKQTEISITLVKELVPNFDGVCDFSNWCSQVQAVRETYNVDTETMKLVIVGCLKHRALNWLRSKPEHIKLNYDELLEELKYMFGQSSSKVMLRRDFEARKWKSFESFMDYFYAKVELGNKLSLDTDEMIEYIIEGINDHQIRNQAKMKRFKTLRKLLEVMKTISIGVREEKKKISSLEKVKRNFGRESDDASHLKCFNCGYRGHLAVNCRKRKGQWGSCYRCGKKGHKADECRQLGESEGAKERNTIRTFHPDYKVDVKFIWSMRSITIEAIIDTGSPVSLMSLSVAEGENFAYGAFYSTTNFYGFNNSKIDILGTTKQLIEVSDIRCLIEFFVVDDTTFWHNNCLLLGRDFINNPEVCTVIRDNKLHIGKESNDIFNMLTIKLDVPTVIDKLNVSLDLGMDVKDKINLLFSKYLNSIKTCRLEPKISNDFQMRINLKKDLLLSLDEFLIQRK